MTRHVMPSAMVAHVWANQGQDHARNGKGSLFFEGLTIYSYRHSWPLARHFRGLILTNPATYSVTTSGHSGKVKRASTQFTQVRCASLSGSGDYSNPKWKPDREKDWAFFERELRDVEQRILRSMTNFDWKLAQRERLIEEANAYAVAMGLKRHLAATDLDLTTIRERVAREEQRRAAEGARWEEQRRERDRLYAIEMETRREGWLAGADVHFRTYTYGRQPTLMRIRGDNLETSQGAMVPIDHAKRAFAAILRCKENGTSWERNGHSIHVGHFTIDRIEANGDFTAGCHNIKWPETERIARQLGVYPPPAQEIAA